MNAITVKLNVSVLQRQLICNIANFQLIFRLNSNKLFCFFLIAKIQPVEYDDSKKTYLR